MGRVAVHTSDSLLDHALTLFASGGPRAVTMAAVARAAGAPSGSLYHRFADQQALLQAMWRRTTARFEQGYSGALGSDPTPEAAIRASAWVVDWCRAHPDEATLLHAGPRSLDLDPTVGKSHDAHRERLDDALAVVVGAVAGAAGRPADEVAFALYDVPLAVVRGYVTQGRAVPTEASDRVRRLVSRLLLG